MCAREAGQDALSAEVQVQARSVREEAQEGRTAWTIREVRGAVQEEVGHADQPTASWPDPRLATSTWRHSPVYGASSKRWPRSKRQRSWTKGQRCQNESEMKFDISLTI